VVWSRRVSPTTAQRSGPVREALAGSDVPAAPTRILIVDEDAAARAAMGVVLGQEGYVCAGTSSPEQALELLRASEFHLVLCDLDAPRQEALRLLDRLRADQPSTAVIFLTAHGDAEAAVECLRRGASDCLTKPPPLIDLVRTLERALAKRRLELARHRYRTSLERRVREKTSELSKALREIEAAYTSA